MSQFIALLNASDPDLLSNIENAGGFVVSVSEPGFVVVEGDQTVADSVAQLQAVQAVSPVDGTWDTSQLSLGDDVGTLVNAWNTSLGADYQAALSDPYRAGEPWDFPNGCDPRSDAGWRRRRPAGRRQRRRHRHDGTGTGTGTGDGTGTDDGRHRPARTTAPAPARATAQSRATNRPPMAVGDAGTGGTDSTDGEQA